MKYFGKSETKSDPKPETKDEAKDETKDESSEPIWPDDSYDPARTQKDRRYGQNTSDTPVATLPIVWQHDPEVQWKEEHHC